jgi:hypothetical protein
VRIAHLAPRVAREDDEPPRAREVMVRRRDGGGQQLLDDIASDGVGQDAPDAAPRGDRVEQAHP